MCCPTALSHKFYRHCAERKEVARRLLVHRQHLTMFLTNCIPKWKINKLKCHEFSLVTSLRCQFIKLEMKLSHRHCMSLNEKKIEWNEFENNINFLCFHSYSMNYTNSRISCTVKWFSENFINGFNCYYLQSKKSFEYKWRLRAIIFSTSF